MEELFKDINLSGVYKEAHEEAVDLLDLTEEEAKAMETVTGLVQLITNMEKLPLEMEIESLKTELKIAKEEARKLKATVNALEEVNKKLKLENNNLLNSLKAMKELSIAEDKIETTIDPTFVAWVKQINNNKNR